jgi:hypothetical protein
MSWGQNCLQLSCLPDIGQHTGCLWTVSFGFFFSLKEGKFGEECVAGAGEGDDSPLNDPEENSAEVQPYHCSQYDMCSAWPSSTCPSTSSTSIVSATPLVQSNRISSSANNPPMLCSIPLSWTGCGLGAGPTTGWSKARPTLRFDRNLSQVASLTHGSTSGFQNQPSLSPNLQYGVGLSVGLPPFQSQLFRPGSEDPYRR